MIKAGRLSKRIMFMRFATVTDDMEQSKGTWAEYKTIWADVRPYKSSEIAFMGKIKPEVTHRIYVRYRTDITADMRILYHGRTFEISGPPIDLDERHELLEIQCQEVFEDERYGV